MIRLIKAFRHCRRMRLALIVASLKIRHETNYKSYLPMHFDGVDFPFDSLLLSAQRGQLVLFHCTKLLVSVLQQIAHTEDYVYALHTPLISTYTVGTLCTVQLRRVDLFELII